MAEMFIVESIPVGPLQCNMSIIADRETGKGVLVDPGGDAEAIIELIDRLKIKIVLILITHAHFDHCLAANKIKEYTGAPLGIHEADMQLLKMIPQQAKMIGMDYSGESPSVDVVIHDGTQLPVLNGIAIHTPGHSPGSTCYYFPPIKTLCSGDTLFQFSIGRTDLWGSSYETIINSIQNKLYTLPGDTIVIPGHGPSTSIKVERKHNMFVKGKDIVAKL